MNGTIDIRTDSRSATVPVMCRARLRGPMVRTHAGQAVLSMLHAWNTAGACAAFKHLKVAAGDSLLYAASATARSEAAHKAEQVNS